MTGTANYNAILGQYYLATATLELEHHYHLLRTLRSGHKQGSSTSSPQRPWTNHVRLTRSGVQHAKIEAVKSLVHVQRRYFAAVRHFRIQNLSLMTPECVASPLCLTDEQIATPDMFHHVWRSLSTMCALLRVHCCFACRALCGNDAVKLPVRYCEQLPHVLF